MSKKMFDMVIGNPPYQEQNNTNGRKPPVYNLFMDAVEDTSNIVELITPARFLFNVGQTSKKWNKKKLSDEHFTVLEYFENSSDVFPNTDIKGGVAITLRNNEKNYGAIKNYIPYKEMVSVVEKVFLSTEKNKFLNSVISPRGNYRTTDIFFDDFSYASERLGKGTGNMIASNFFEKLPEASDDGKNNLSLSVKLLAIIGKKRTVCYLQKKYLQDNDFLSLYNVACPKANGSGYFGEKITGTEILAPNEGATDTFISIGKFNDVIEAKNFQKYIKTKFFRSLLGIKKVTQDNPKSVWSLIPIQDFTAESDIDWSKSISEIDQRLYEKYGLNEKEINFIETHVKEMA